MYLAQALLQQLYRAIIRAEESSGSCVYGILQQAPVSQQVIGVEKTSKSQQTVTCTPEICISTSMFYTLIPNIFTLLFANDFRLWTHDIQKQE